MNPARVTLLDMGEEKYGDSILCQFGAKTILIDGGHLHDDMPHAGYPSLPQQLEGLTGQSPLRLDLLVVTHCHADHIGCLPKLVEQGKLTAKWALLADPNLGWGKIGNVPDTADAPTGWDSADPVSPIHAVVTALMDDRPLSALSDQELAEALADAANLWTSYTGMINRLKRDGTKVVRYGIDSHASLVAAFSDCKMKIIGPTKAHLLTCARFLARVGRDALDQAMALASRDAAIDTVELFRELASEPELGADMAGTGAALNDQSIVLRFELNQRRILLTGDMQLAEAQVPDLESRMQTLSQRIQNDGPFFFAKTPHHTSYNGINSTVLSGWGPATLLAHSGGLKDPGHPERGALDDIRALDRQQAFARTDRNGQIKLDLAANSPRLVIGRGTLDDFRVNPKPRPHDVETSPAAPRAGSPAVRVERHDEGDFVEVITRIPRVATRVRLTIDVEPVSENLSAADRTRVTEPAADIQLGGGRQFPRLLFVTSAKALAANLDANVVNAARKAIKAANCDILDDLPAPVSVDVAAARVHEALGKRQYDGIVLLGGYDVVPSARLDTLTSELRRLVEAQIPDPDDFIVWSDAIYGDTDGDTFSEFPVSRVPDAKSRDLFLAALQAGADVPTKKLCVHNVKRPFAQTIFRRVTGDGKALSSGPAALREARAEQAGMLGNIYLMLHGADTDGSAFWGEDAATGYLVEAFDVSCLPPRAGGVIFTGACWGALIVTRKATAQSLDRPAQSKVPDQSLALAALRAGYRAFIGCTGSHYSPLGRQPNSAGGPLHEHFWKFLRQAKPPAEALFLAKREYAKKIPYGNDPVEEAVDQKIVRQFTCLGLGW